jgi:hypothetical protein
MGRNHSGAVSLLALARPCCARGTNPPAPALRFLRCLQSSRLCLLINPILPGSRSIPDLAGVMMIEAFTLPARRNSSGAGQELNLDFPEQALNGLNRQFTNRRMRTFIATPSARNVNNTEDPP